MDQQLLLADEVGVEIGHDQVVGRFLGLRPTWTTAAPPTLCSGIEASSFEAWTQPRPGTQKQCPRVQTRRSLSAMTVTSSAGGATVVRNTGL